MTTASTLPTPNSSTGFMYFEPVLRQFLAYQLKQIIANVNDPGITFIDEMFARWGDDVRLQIKKWLATTGNISVDINFPQEHMTLPLIAVVSAEDNEKTAEAVLGDFGGTLYIGGSQVTKSNPQTLPPNVYGQAEALPDDRPLAMEARYLLSVPEARITRLYIATDDADSVLYLYTIVKALLIVNKLDFDQFVGVRNLKLNGGDLEHRQDLLPQFAYMKQLTLSYDTNFDVPTSPTGTIGGMNVSITAAFNGANISLTT